ncbi:MAG: helix-turn-helix domain-containing protein [Oscillospiraceae bacterium]|nr:helix-turn-helix domain-containing protein [Oscillospiraceae bacterium]
MKFKKYPKRDPIKNYFPLPNEIFCLGLFPGEISVYSYLLYCEDRKTFQCYPSYRTIGNALKISKNTVRKYVSGLEEKGLITTEPTKIIKSNGMKYNGNLMYTIRSIEEAKDKYLQSQLGQAELAMAQANAKRQLEEYDRKNRSKAV